MKQVSKFLLGSVASLLISNNVFAADTAINKQELQSEINSRIELAITEIEQPNIQKLAKLHADQTNFKQIVGQILVIAKYNEELTTVKPQKITE